MALFTIADLEALLQTTITDAVAADAARTRAENYLRDQLGVEFTSAARTFAGRVPASRTFQRLSTPLDAVASVTVDGTALVEGTDWERTASGVACPGGFARGTAASTATLADWCDLTIAYTSGWATPPDDIKDWGVYLGAKALQMGPTPGVVQQTAGPFSVTVDQDSAPAGGLSLPPDILRSLRAKYGTGRRLTGSTSIR